MPSENSIDRPSPVKRALHAIQDLQTRLDAAEQATRAPIAVIGMACRFPGGADTPERFWGVLRDGVDTIQEVPAARWDIEAYYDANPETPGKMTTRSGAFLADVASFDAGFFGIAPREAISMDPQQRLLLEVSWEALERAGQAVDRLEGSDTGVFIGISSHDYGIGMIYGGDIRRIDAYSGTGNVSCVAAGRVSYCLGLQGPNVAIDTACSSSLVAVHLACQSLRLQECGLALAGGVNLTLTPENTVYFSKLRALAPDGQCKAFDARANGFVRGEGCGVVVLKRWADARRDGDPVLAVIRGSAVNQDGRSSGLTVPNGVAQQQVIRAALAQGQVEAGAVGYVEAHGTGTPLGDPIELRSLAAVLGAGRAPESPVLVGSVKTNIGHLEAAAGVAGLMKVVLALQHGSIPANLHFVTPSPHIAWETLPVRVPTQLTPWPAGARRVAGVSSFGFSGTNAHLVVEAAPASEANDTTAAAETPVVVPVSARSAAALEALAAAFAAALPALDATAHDIGYTASVRRSHHSERLAVVGRTRTELADALSSWIAGTPSDNVRHGHAVSGRRKIAFVFPGQGSHTLGVGRELYEREPVFRGVLDTCDRLLRRHVEWSLVDELWATPDRSRLGDTAIEQPALFAIQIALAALWRAWGIEPDVLIGTSRGEVAAAAVAGVLSLEDAIDVAYHRGRLQRLVIGRGKMAAVGLTADECEQLPDVRGGRLSVAAVNSPASTIVSGDADAIDNLLATLTARGVFSRPLTVEFASHCAHMDAICPALVEALAAIRPRAASIPLLSTVTAGFAESGDFGPAYWARNIRERVRFRAAVDVASREGIAAWIEIGPHPVMLQPLNECLAERGADAPVIASLNGDLDPHTSMLRSLATLYTSGCSPNWDRLFQRPARVVPLPVYCFDRTKYWVERARASDAQSAEAVERGHHPLLGHRARAAQHAWVFESKWGGAAHELLPQRRLLELHVVGGSVFAEMAIAAADMTSGGDSIVVRDLDIAAPLVLDPERSRVVQTFVDDDAAGLRLRIAELDEAHDRSEDRWTSLATATIAREETGAEVTIDGDALAARGETIGAVRIAEPRSSEMGSYRLHPDVLDEAARVLWTSRASTADRNDRSEASPFLITAIDTLRYHRGRGQAVAVRAVVRARTDAGGIVGDIHLVDSMDRVVAAIEGLRVESVAKQDLLRAALKRETEWLYEVRWREATPSARIRSDTAQLGRWLILSDDGGTGAALAQRLERAGHQVLVAYAARPGAEARNGCIVDPTRPEEFQSLFRAAFDGDGPPCRGIVDLWPLNTIVPDAPRTCDAIQRAQAMTCGAALHVVQAAAAVPSAAGTHVWLVTRRAQQVSSGATMEPAQAPVWSFGRVLRLEHPDLFGGLIDLDEATSDRESLDLLAELTRPAADEQIAYRGGRRYVARLTRSDVSKSGGARLRVRSDATYLIVGGLGALGLELARWIIERGARHLLLMGRTAPSQQAAETIRDLECRGAHVVVALADATDLSAVTAVLGAIPADLPLRGVFYSAGTFDDGTILAQAWPKFAKVVDGTIAGAWNLHEVTRGVNLDLFVLFSSAVSLFGNYGQASYASAKAFLGGLAAYRRSQGLPAISIEWGQWSGVGMAASAEMRRRADVLAGRGVVTIPPSRGFDVLDLLPAADCVSQLVVVPIHWPTFVASLTAGEAPALLQELITATFGDAVPAARTEHSMRAIFDSASDDQRHALVLEYLRSRFARVLRTTAEIPEDRRIIELGVDSVMVIEVINAIRRDFELMIYPREVYERPTLGQLVPYLVAQLQTRVDHHETQPAGHAAADHRPTVWERVGPAIVRHQRLPGIVFVLSTPRAGSTLLRVMLAGHPGLFAPPELHLLPFDSMKQRLDALAGSHLDEGLQRAVMELQSIDAAASRRLVEAWIDEELSIHDVYARLQTMAAGRTLVDKSPTYSISIDTLTRAESLFDGAKYVHLVRHPYAVIESFVRMRMDRLAGIEEADPYALAERVWATSNQNILDFLASVDQTRWRRLYYEDLVRAPDATMRRLCEFLGIEFDAATLAPYEGRRMTDGLHPHSMPIDDPNFQSHTTIEAQLSDVWRTIQLPVPLGDAARRTSGRLEYELPPDSDGFSIEAGSELLRGTEEFVDAAGLRLCVTTWGSDAARPVLCLHGILDHGVAWEHVAALLVRDGFRVIAPDLRGHGRSDHVPRGACYHTLDFLADIDALVRTLAVSPFVLVGHSLGAALAASWTRVRPEMVQALVLVEPLVPSASAQRDAVERLTTHLEYLASEPRHPILENVETAAERLRLQSPALSEAMARRMAARLTEPHAGGVRWRWDPVLRTRTGLALGSELTRSEYLALLAGIPVPLTIAFGESSGFVRPQDRSDLVAALPQATVVQAAGGHNLHVDAPVELSRVVGSVALAYRVVSSLRD